MKNISKILIPIAIIIAAFIIAQALRHFIPQRVPGALSLEQAGIKAMNYLNQKTFRGERFASLVDVNEARLYRISFKIEDDEEDNTYDIYMTKDGKITYSRGEEISEEISSSELWTKPEPPKTDTPQVQLFVMSFCPYGNQAEELMMPVAELLGDKSDIKLRYIISKSSAGDDSPDDCLIDGENKYCSMHGIQELNQDVRELCVQKYQKDKLWDFVKAINNNCSFEDVDSCWEGIAKQTGVNVQQVKTCYKDEVLEILAQEVELNEKYGVGGSPYLVINETEYMGPRTSEGYKQGICSAFNSVPDECSQVLSSEGGPASGSCK